jgi:membrane protein implicated in regulation of membrane protease activity
MNTIWMYALAFLIVGLIYLTPPALGMIAWRRDALKRSTHIMVALSCLGWDAVGTLFLVLDQPWWMVAVSWVFAVVEVLLHRMRVRIERRSRQEAKRMEEMWSPEEEAFDDVVEARLEAEEMKWRQRRREMQRRDNERGR